MENTVKKGSTVWIIIGFILAPIGGIGGMIIGANYAFGNFDRQTKLLGYFMLAFSLIMVRVLAGA